MSLLTLQPNGGSQTLPEEGREMFRRAVAKYQIFVVPHCTPFVVKTYADARAARDRRFVQSLHGTELEGDYVKAVADEARLDRQRVYECMDPPPQPPNTKQQRSTSTLYDAWASHTKEGDKQFAVMVRLRDSLLGGAHQ